MRVVLAAMLAAVLGACTGASDGARCDLSFSRDIAFSTEATSDTLIVRTLGPACDKTVGLLAIHDSEGHPIWAWSAPLQRAFGDQFAAATHDDVRAFLQSWAEPSYSSTQAAPEWDRLAPGQTTLDQLTYSDIRARDLPMLCHVSGTARQTCVFWEPAAGGAGHFLDRDVEETAQ